MNKIQTTGEFLSSILQLDQHGIQITGAYQDPVTHNIILITEGGEFTSEYIRLSYTRPYDKDGTIDQPKQQLVLTIKGD